MEFLESKKLVKLTLSFLTLITLVGSGKDCGLGQMLFNGTETPYVMDQCPDVVVGFVSLSTSLLLPVQLQVLTIKLRSHYKMKTKSHYTDVI